MISHTLSAEFPRLDMNGENPVASADALPADRSLLKLLREIEEAPPRPAAYLHTLERLRKPILLAQEDLADEYSDKPLPLDQNANAALARASELWAAALRGYRRLLAAALGGNHPELETSLGLICQRALAGAAELFVTRFLARREIEDSLWQFVNEIYLVAESRGLGSAAAGPHEETPPVVEYAKILLLHLANPYALATREFGWVRHWIGRWSSKVQVLRGAPRQSGYAIDLAGHAGPTWMKPGAGGESLRYVDLAEVGSSIKKRLRRLENGVEPAALGMGEDCTPREAAELLKTLGRAWLESPTARDFTRGGATLPTLLASGFSTVHRALGENSRPTSTDRPGYSYGEADRVQTLERAFDAGANWESHLPGLENWERFEESASGFRLCRKTPGASLALRQLLAIRPRGARQFMICEVRSVAEGADRSLSICARPLPGFARTCTVQAADQKTQSPADALLLPPGQGLPSVLLLPAGWYQSGREIEIREAGRVTRVRLAALLERGFDYERVQTNAA